jgi:hypothetical protein
MIHQPPRLLKILCPTPDIITSTNHPNRPASLPLGHQFLNTRRIRLRVRVVRLVEPKLGQNHGHLVDRGRPRRAETIVPQPALHAAAVGDVVLVVVQLEHEFVLVGEVAELEFLAVAQVLGAGNGIQLGVVVEAGEEDEDVGVGFVDGVGSGNYLVVPGGPVVGEGGAGVVRLAELVAEANGDHVGPLLALVDVLEGFGKRFGRRTWSAMNSSPRTHLATLKSVSPNQVFPSPPPQHHAPLDM